MAQNFKIMKKNLVKKIDEYMGALETVSKSGASLPTPVPTTGGEDAAEAIRALKAGESANPKLMAVGSGLFLYDEVNVGLINKYYGIAPAKPTPGPWYISPQSKYIRANGVHGWNIAEIVEQEPYTKANAKLIASAPLLLEALKEAKKMILKLEQARANSSVTKEKLNELFHTVREAINSATL